MGLHYRAHIDITQANPQFLPDIIQSVRVAWPCPHSRYAIEDDRLSLSLSGNGILSQSCESIATQIVQAVEVANHASCMVVVELIHLLDKDGREASEASPYRMEHNGATPPPDTH